MKKIVASILHRAMIGTKIAFKFAFLLPVLAAMVWVNYTVDLSGFFQGEQKEREVVTALMAGENVPGYDQMDEQKVYALYVQNLEHPLDTIAVGSSRILQLTKEIAGTDSFMNCGVSGADIRDVIDMFFLFDRADKLPKNMIIGIDPWLLNGNQDAYNLRSDVELYNEFLSTRLGMDVPYQKPDNTAKYKALFSPTYLQGNLTYLLNQTKETNAPAGVTGNVSSQASSIKMADGSVLYPESFRNASQDVVNEKARQEATTFLRMEGFAAPDPILTDVFEKFVLYAQSRGVNVVFLMSPYHPLVYNYASENAEKYTGFFETEPWYTALAKKHSIPLYGSYNPFVTRTFEDSFYDGLHIKGPALATIFPGIQQSVQAKNVQDASSPWVYHKPRVSYETAEFLVVERYEIPESEAVRQAEDLEIDGTPYYLLERYSVAGAKEVLLASYAVSQTEGEVLRFDTTNHQWVLDKRF